MLVGLVLVVGACGLPKSSSAPEPGQQVGQGAAPSVTAAPPAPAPLPPTPPLYREPDPLNAVDRPVNLDALSVFDAGHTPDPSGMFWCFSFNTYPVASSCTRSPSACNTIRADMVPPRGTTASECRSQRRVACFSYRNRLQDVTILSCQTSFASCLSALGAFRDGGVDYDRFSDCQAVWTRTE